MGSENPHEIVRVHLALTRKALEELRAIAAHRYPGRGRRDSQTAEELIHEAYTREIEQQGEGAKR